MKIVLFGSDRRLGALHGDRVVDLGHAGGGALPTTLSAFIEAGADAIDEAGLAATTALADLDQHAIDPPRVLRSDEATLHPPLVDRGARIMCAASNYPDHYRGMRRIRRGETLTLEAAREAARTAGITGFWKIAQHVVGPDHDIIYPSRTSMLDYEGEVAVVIGRRGKDIPLEAAADYIWGFTLLNDLSARDQPEPRPHTFSLGKNFDSSATLGPCIVAGEIDDPRDIHFETRVNGELRQSGCTREMIFGFEEYIAYMSRDITLVPGDVISGGTCAGTATDTAEVDDDGVATSTWFLHPGDRVEIASPSIGVLGNTVVAKPDAHTWGRGSP